MSSAFKALPRFQFLGLPMLSWVALMSIACLYILLNRTQQGRVMYAVGGNPDDVCFWPDALRNHRTSRQGK